MARTIEIAPRDTRYAVTTGTTPGGNETSHETHYNTTKIM